MHNRYIDFHCHILPGMDFDGTDHVRESVAMCKQLKSQGVATVCATPHFYPWNEDVDAFLARRDKALAVLQAEECPVEIIPGAEVQIFQALPECRVDKMCIGESNVVLFEMPRLPFQTWMITSIENAVYKYALTPVIAHIERYGFTAEQLRKFAHIPNVVFQITVSELNHKRSLKMLDMVSSCGVPVVLGSDAHNMTSRAPQFDVIGEKTAEKAGLFNRQLKATQTIIENCLYAQLILENKIRTPMKTEVQQQ
ncbi:MAG: hypothetical protein IJX64_00430 [Clostridia bacterium]|nr:hypothetical protein [Clostridia bacterium]